MKKYAYIRVSSKDQNIDRQVAAMKEAGIDEKDMYIDKQSGKDFDRKKYKQLTRKLKPGDELYIKSIDRLGRDYDEIIEQWRYLIRIKDIDIIVLDFPLLDTRNQVHGLTGKFLADIILQVLSYVAQLEREHIKQSQAEGIKTAMEKGVRFGRPLSSIPDEFEEVYHLWKQGTVSKREAARMIGANHNTFSSWIRRYENEEDNI